MIAVVVELAVTAPPPFTVSTPEPNTVLLLPSATKLPEAIVNPPEKVLLAPDRTKVGGVPEPPDLLSVNKLDPVILPESVCVVPPSAVSWKKL